MRSTLTYRSEPGSDTATLASAIYRGYIENGRKYQVSLRKRDPLTPYHVLVF